MIVVDMCFAIPALIAINYREIYLAMLSSRSPDRILIISP